MAEASPRLGDGNIVFKLGNEELVLKPSIHAARTLTTRYENLMAVIERAARLDFNLIVDIIALGLGQRTIVNAKAREALAERIYEAGLTDDTGGLATVAVEYVHSLMRGGRPKASEKDTNEEDALGN